MSNVLSRFRSESALEFYTTARKIRGQLTRWAMNEKNIPKHYRLVLAFPLLSICDNLMNNITAANSVYPVNEHELQVRRDHQNAALGSCEQIWQQLQHIDDVMFEVKLMRNMVAKLGLTLSAKKTQIVPISKGFRFLKSRYRVTDAGHVVETPWRVSVTRMRRKLAKFKGFVVKGEMSYVDALNAYLSWRGSILKQDAHRTAREMDRVFCVYFGQWPYTKKEMKQRGLFGIG